MSDFRVGDVVLFRAQPQSDRKPKPTHEAPVHVPTQAEQIATLTARVAELEPALYNLLATIFGDSGHRRSEINDNQKASREAIKVYHEKRQADDQRAYQAETERDAAIAEAGRYRVALERIGDTHASGGGASSLAMIAEKALATTPPAASEVARKDHGETCEYARVAAVAINHEHVKKFVIDCCEEALDGLGQEMDKITYTGTGFEPAASERRKAEVRALELLPELLAAYQVRADSDDVFTSNTRINKAMTKAWSIVAALDAAPGEVDERRAIGFDEWVKVRRKDKNVCDHMGHDDCGPGWVFTMDAAPGEGTDVSGA